MVHAIKEGKEIQSQPENFQHMSFAEVLQYKDVDGSLEYRERLRCRVIPPHAAAFNIVVAGIDAVKPGALMKKHVVIDSESVLRIYDFDGVERFTQKVSQNVHILGAGKAALGMFESVYSVLKDHVKEGLLIIPSEAATLAGNLHR